MIIDRGHVRWGIATGLLAAAATALYVAYSRAAPSGPSGGSWQGLAFGLAGFSLMTFAALLGARRRVRTWRLGRASAWLKGHLWLGLLSVPLILFHGGLGMGGLLTTTLLVLLFAVVGSGLAGIVIQQVLPRLMSESIPLETIYDEIPHVCEQLRAEADRLIAAACDDLEMVPETETSLAAVVSAGGGAAAGAGIPRIWQASAVAPTAATHGASALSPRAASAPRASDPVAPAAAPLREIYLTRLRPHLAYGGPGDPEMARRDSAAGLFERIRALVPPSLAESVDDLADICEERRQLRTQERLHRVLHGWLFVHVPLTMALMALSVFHALWALRY